jgi:hypothetical protein
MDVVKIQLNKRLHGWEAEVPMPWMSISVISSGIQPAV